jgi:hypothetical protein
MELHLPLPLGELGPADAAGLCPGAVAAVAAALAAAGADKAVVVLDVCRQDRLMEYAHLHAVRHGSARSFAEQFPYAREPVLDWAELADRIEAVPGVAEVVLRPVEAHGDLLDGPTFSARGVRVARALNAHVEPAEQALVRDFVAATFPGPPMGNQFLRAQTRTQILAAYAALNRALFRSRLSEFDEDAYSDDAHTDALSDREKAHEHRGQAGR